MPETTGRVAGVRLTHPERPIHAGQGATKRDLALYYESVGERMLPHIADRPLTLLRCTQGREKPCFYQKKLVNMPAAVHGVEVPDKGGSAVYVTIDSLAGLLALVQMDVLEIHPWGAKNRDLAHPDRLVFDLDPDPQLPWRRLCEVARLVRGHLEHLGLQGFLRTTGGKGVHVVVPIAPTLDWQEAKTFCRLVAQAVVRSAPDQCTAKMAKDQRNGKVFIDYLRNAQGATAVATWSTRARQGTPIAVPLAWDELEDLGRADRFVLRDIGGRLSQPDPWPDLARVKQRVTAAMRARLRT